MHGETQPRVSRVPVAALTVLAFLVGAEMARPFRAASIAFDSQIAVLSWDRIASGQLLERFIPTTSKPLLTVVFGPLHALANDWRPISLATIVVFGVAVGGAYVLVRREAGPIAGTFAAVGLIGSSALLLDVGLALATPWALAGWVAAGILICRERPRYGLAGLALMVASLARIETLVLVGTIVLALIVARGTGRRPSPRAWLTPLVALGALPVMCLHDWLLLRDPFMWATVASRYSAQTTLEVLSPIEVVGFLSGRYAEMGALTLLAVLGVGRLIVARRWSLVVGLIGLGPGVAAFLVLLAIRGIFVSDRYAAPIDVAVLAAAGIGFAGLSHEVVSWTARATAGNVRFRDRREVLAALTAGLVAAVLVWPNGPLDEPLRTTIRNSRAVAIDSDAAVPILRQGLASGTADAVVAVPTPVRPRLAIDLGLPLTTVADSGSLTLDGLTPGLVVFHHRLAERNPGAVAFFEIESSTPAGDRTLELLASDPKRGWWIVRVR